MHAPTKGHKVYHKDPKKHSRYGAGLVVGGRETCFGSSRPAKKSVLVRWSKLAALNRSPSNDPMTWESPSDLRVTRPRYGKEKKASTNL